MFSAESRFSKSFRSDFFFFSLLSFFSFFSPLSFLFFFSLRAVCIPLISSSIALSSASSCWKSTTPSAPWNPAAQRLKTTNRSSSPKQTAWSCGFNRSAVPSAHSTPKQMECSPLALKTAALTTPYRSLVSRGTYSLAWTVTS